MSVFSRILASVVILVGLAGGITLRMMPVGPDVISPPSGQSLQVGPVVDLGQLAPLPGQMRMLRRTEPIAPTARHALSDYRLLGVVEADEGGWALLQDMDGVVTVRVGGQALGYELIELSPDRAVFARGEEEVVLQRVF